MIFYNLDKSFSIDLTSTLEGELALKYDGKSYTDYDVNCSSIILDKLSTKVNKGTLVLFLYSRILVMVMRHHIYELDLKEALNILMSIESIQEIEAIFSRGYVVPSEAVPKTYNVSNRMGTLNIFTKKAELLDSNGNVETSLMFSGDSVFRPENNITKLDNPGFNHLSNYVKFLAIKDFTLAWSVTKVHVQFGLYSITGNMSTIISAETTLDEMVDMYMESWGLLKPNYFRLNTGYLLLKPLFGLKKGDTLVLKGFADLDLHLISLNTNNKLIISSQVIAMLIDRLTLLVLN